MNRYQDKPEVRPRMQSGSNGIQTKSRCGEKETLESGWKPELMIALCSNTDVCLAGDLNMVITQTGTRHH